MTITYCPAAIGTPSGATWRCNLLSGHVGLHDDGMGRRWGDTIHTDGPDRLQVAAVNLLGSHAAWDELRPALEQALGLVQGEAAVNVVHDVLAGWMDGGAS